MIQTQLGLHNPAIHHRPAVHRSRSHTDPQPAGTTPTEPQTAGPSLQSTRPPHIRSQSYLSPGEAKPRNAATLPAPSALERTADKLPRLHLPGSSHRHHHHSQSHSHSRSNNAGAHKRHRPTQSESHPTAFRQPRSKEALSNLPHLVAGLNAERSKYGQAITQPRAGQNAFGPSGTQITDYGDGGRYDPRLRATSDPNRAALRPKASFEIALARGDEARVARRIHVKREDIEKRDAEILAAEDELRSRVTSITSAGVENTRRLDYGYYSLLETLGSLVANITSFQSVSTQTGQLISNFDKETQRLDTETKKRVGGFKAGFEARRRKAEGLAERGKKVGDKAEGLSLRLENARQIVENWEKREDQVRKAWSRVFGIVLWTSISILVLVVLVVLGKEWWFRGDPVKAGLRAHSEGSWNRSLRLGGDKGTVAWENQKTLLQEGGADAANMPEDVRLLLLDIAERNHDRKVVFPQVPKEIVGGCDEAEARTQEDEDPRMRKLDEL